jgi:hypothetical protein
LNLKPQKELKECSHCPCHPLVLRVQCLRRLVPELPAAQWIRKKIDFFFATLSIRVFSSQPGPQLQAARLAWHTLSELVPTTWLPSGRKVQFSGLASLKPECLNLSRASPSRVRLGVRACPESGPASVSARGTVSHGPSQRDLSRADSTFGHFKSKVKA